LEPYLVGDSPTIRGEDEHEEWDMFCPLHEDSQRSSGINLDAGVWYCQKCDEGGRVEQLIERKDEWLPPPADTGVRTGRSSGAARPAGRKEEIDDAHVAGWVSALWSNEDAVEGLMLARGLYEETIREYELGWDSARSCYSLPIRDAEGALVNIRRYTLNPAPGRRKMWSVSGMGKPTLYPFQVFEGDPQSIIVCEGELDALISIQNGHPAVTRTGSAGTWRPQWGEHFAGRQVYLCHDMDHAGQDANRKVAKALERVAKDIRIIKLPYKVRPKHGKDLTDFWLQYDREDFANLMREASAEVHAGAVRDVAPGDAAVIDSFDAKNVGMPLRLTVTIKGKREPGYSVVREAALTCTRDAGEKCAVCPLYPAQGEDLLIVQPNDPVVLELIESTRGQVADILRAAYGTPKCNKLLIEPLEYQGVEVLFARPSVDHANGKSEDYKNIKITSVGRHDTQPNNTVQVVGALFPEPRHQQNEFQAWDVERLQTSIDKFEMTPAIARTLNKFQPRDGERPLKKLGRISRELAAHVTKIYGRPELHAALDLVWHSALAFTFDGNSVGRGWLELLVVGDTRTGKSEAATRLAGHYRAGEVVSCESASYAGIVGGAQQFGSRGEWAITWGAIPLNDRRLVVLDEVSGLTPEAIAQMSSVRSSGTAEITKIQQERTYARTRLVWLGNPRNARMGDFTYGVQAISPLIGNPEDVARFDLAMCVRAGEVPAHEINRSHAEGKLTYHADACSQLVRWVWSRTPDQIKWARGAEQAVYKAAEELGERYVEDPPLVQVANVRIKVARLAVALAARLFSTDAKHECIVVKREHVEDAVAFLDMLYNMPSFGYAERSKEAIQDAAEAHAQYDEVKGYLRTQHGLAKFLRNAGTFRRQDLEEILNIERSEANAVINSLWASRMVRKEKGDVRVLPALHDLLREVK
jgi:hypothetical protein